MEFNYMDLYNEKEMNYIEFEKKLKAVIVECDKKKLKETEKLDKYYNKYNIKEADQVEHYILENGLHVYKIINKKGNPIDYFFSSEPVIEEYEYESSNKKYKTQRVRNVAFIEYSCGGIGNSLPIHITKYSLTNFIGIATTDFKEAHLRSSIKSSLGSAFVYDHLTVFGEFSNILMEENAKNADNQDLYSYIKNFSSQRGNKDKEKIDQLKKSLEMVDQIALKKETKKGFLKGLLQKDKELADKLNPFVAKSR